MNEEDECRCFVDWVTFSVVRCQNCENQIEREIRDTRRIRMKIAEERKRAEEDRKEIEEISEQIRLEVAAERKNNRCFDRHALEPGVKYLVREREEDKENIIDWETLEKLIE